MSDLNIEEFSNDEIQSIRNHLKETLTNNKKVENCLDFCKKYHVDPTAEEVYFVNIKDKIKPIISYSVIMQRAKQNNIRVNITHEDWDNVEEACIYLKVTQYNDKEISYDYWFYKSECEPKTDFMKNFMTKKIAIVRALKLSGISDILQEAYSEEEYEMIKANDANTKDQNDDGIPF